MTYEIQTQKGFDGWRAESKAELGDTPEGKRMLELTTCKTRGGLAARASVFIYKGEGSFFAKTTEIFGDFSKSGIAATPCNRVTEKAVLEVHNRALLEMDAIIKEAKAFYEAKEQQAA